MISRYTHVIRTAMQELAVDEPININMLQNSVDYATIQAKGETTYFWQAMCELIGTETIYISGRNENGKLLLSNTPNSNEQILDSERYTIRYGSVANCRIPKVPLELLKSDVRAIMDYIENYPDISVDDYIELMAARFPELQMLFETNLVLYQREIVIAPMVQLMLDEK